MVKVPSSACKLVLSKVDSSGCKVLFPVFMCSGEEAVRLNSNISNPKRVSMDEFLIRGFAIEGTMTFVLRECNTKKEAYSMFMKTCHRYSAICRGLPSNMVDSGGDYTAVWERMIHSLPSLDGFSVREDNDPEAAANKKAAEEANKKAAEEAAKAEVEAAEKAEAEAEAEAAEEPAPSTAGAKRKREEEEGEEVEITGQRTWEDRNREGFASAIQLD